MTINHYENHYYQRVNLIETPLNHHFPMVFLWFSHGFPLVIPMIPEVAPALWQRLRGAAALRPRARGTPVVVAMGKSSENHGKTTGKP